MTINIIINEHIISNIEFSLELLFRNTFFVRSGPELDGPLWTRNGPKMNKRGKFKQNINRKNDLLCYKVTFVIIFTSIFKWTCGRWRYSLFWFVENWSNHCPLSSSFSNYLMVMISTCTIVSRLFKMYIWEFFSLK